MDWYNENWLFRFKITSDNTKVSASIKGLALDLSNAPAGFWTNVKSDGSDIRITSSDGTSLVARDIIVIDTGGNTGLVRLDTSNISTSTDTDFFVYYGNSSATEPAAGDTYGQYNTYDADLEGYWVGPGSGSTFNDRTSNQYHGTIVNASWTGGRTLDALSFNGSNTYVDVGPTPLNSDRVTVRSVVRPSTLTGGRQTLFCADEHMDGSNQQCISSIDDGSGAYISWVNNSGTWTSVSGGSTARSEWYTYSFVYVGNTMYLRKDGVNIATFSNSNGMNIVSSANKSSIGSRSSLDTHYYNGLIEQSMVFRRGLSLNEDETMSLNEASNATFWSIGTDEEVPSSGGTARRQLLISL